MNLEKIIEFGEIKGQILAIKEIPIKIWPSIGKNYKIGVKDEETFKIYTISDYTRSYDGTRIIKDSEASLVPFETTDEKIYNAEMLRE